MWDAVAKIARRAAPPPARRPLQRRPGAGEDVLLCRRRLVPAGPDRRRSAGRDAPPSRCRLHHGQDEGRRRCPRRGLPAHRSGARRCSATRRGSRSTPTASSTAPRRSPMPRRCGRSGSNGSRSRAIRSTTRSMPRSPRPMTRPLAAGENLYSTQDVRTSCASAACARAATSSRSIRRRPTGSRNTARPSRCWRAGAGAAPRFSPRRQPDVARDRCRLRPRRRGILSRRVRRLRRLCRRCTVEDGYPALSDRPGIGFEGQAALYALMRPLAE